MELKSINQNTEDGRLLMAAIAMLTTSKSICIFGEQKDGTMLTPDTVLTCLKTLADRMDEDHGTKGENPESPLLTAARPLIKLLAMQHHPHTKCIVTSTGAEMVEGVKTTGEILDYLRN